MSLFFAITMTVLLVLNFAISVKQFFFTFWFMYHYAYKRCPMYVDTSNPWNIHLFRTSQNIFQKRKHCRADWAKPKYRGMLETQEFGNKTSSREIDLNIRTLASPKVGQDQVCGGASVLCWHAEFFTLVTTFLKSLNYTFKRNNCQYSFQSFGKLTSSTKIPISTSMYAIYTQRYPYKGYTILGSDTLLTALFATITAYQQLARLIILKNSYNRYSTVTDEDNLLMTDKNPAEVST